MCCSTGLRLLGLSGDRILFLDADRHRSRTSCAHPDVRVYTISPWLARSPGRQRAPTRALATFPCNVRCPSLGHCGRHASLQHCNLLSCMLPQDTSPCRTTRSSSTILWRARGRLQMTLWCCGERMMTDGDTESTWCWQDGAHQRPWTTHHHPFPPLNLSWVMGHPYCINML